MKASNAGGFAESKEKRYVCQCGKCLNGDITYTNTLNMLKWSTTP